MKTTLLIIGILGVLASLFSAILNNDISNNIIGFICGLSLIWASYDLRKKENKEANSLNK